jgi:hypothetical protein
MYKDDSKTKLAMAKLNNAAMFKEAELAKDVIGTSVKGMSEDMIDAMIPKGAKIEDYYVDMNDKIQSYSADTVAKMEKTAKDSANVVESYSTTISSSSKQISADIADALPVKEMAAKQAEFQSQFTESQQKIIDDYKGYSEENRSFHAQAMQSGIKEDTETAQMIGARISKMKADIGDRQATEEEQKALENETLNKAMFEKQVESKKEMLDVMQNLGDYSAKRELELKQKAIDDAIAIDNKKTNAINAELPVNGVAMGPQSDQEANQKKQMALQLKASGVDVGAMEAAAEKERQAAWDSAVPEKINTKTVAPKKSIADMMGGLEIGANGMPIMRSIDSAKQTLNQKTPSPGKKINQETGEEYTPVEELAKQQGKKAAAEKKPESKTATKESTLSDVVSALNTLNKQMGQLIAVSEEGHKSTTKATKSSASNIYAR